MLNNIKEKIGTILKSELFYSLLLVVFCVPALYAHLPIRVDITQQDSLEHKLWLTYSDLAKETKYVLFQPPKTRFTQNPEIKYLKMIGCKEGEYLKTVNSEYYCEDRYLGTALNVDMQGNLIGEHFIYNGIVPEHKLFVIGTHKYSWDSKYFGFIDQKQILRKAEPLL